MAEIVGIGVSKRTFDCALLLNAKCKNKVCVFRPKPATDSDRKSATISSLLGIGGRYPSE